jgi:putative tricarboxylic transport membrane protein
MTAALSYLIVFRKERPKRKAEEIEGGEETENTQKMVGMFVVLGVYIASIHFFGYLPATLLFFLLIHRLVGFRSWWLNAGTTTFASIAFYYVFVHGLGMIFPKGVILEWLRGG